MNGRSWKTLLVGSVLLNVFLLGAIAGGAWRWFAVRDEPQAQAAQRVALRFATEELSPERQQQFARTLKSSRREGSQYARDGRDGRREVLDLLAAPQLDRNAIDAALARTRAADSALRAQIESGVVDFAATLTPEERVKFVEGLEKRGQWRLPAQLQKQPQKAASEKNGGQ
ncbi:periplasmic heavy metal sensor [Paraburkholderia silvatlantica]|uniref:periplasmic heavy metal sensor n=1 Tax=Paraburkholderia silvatlantica TaxID=321895 RepID=UPI00105B78B4|nr:periplasmic heavy metal sensor [Paraburkholderia silvatlantica]TDQ80679.1 putative membrane protein [Paraburkholderia silvatlantica]